MLGEQPYDPLRPVAELGIGTFQLYCVEHTQHFDQPASSRPLFKTREEAEHYKRWICEYLNPRVVKVKVTVEEVE